MATKRDILRLLKRDELLHAADRLDVEVADRRVKDGFVEAFGRVHRAPLAEVLEGLSRDRLKDVCRAAGLDEKGRAKADLVERLVEATSNRAARPQTEKPRPSREAQDQPVTRKDPSQEDRETTESTITTLEEGKILDYVTGKPVEDTPKEEVRQRIARAFFHEYGILVDDMAPDFRLKVDGRAKKVDLAVFEPGSEHQAENVRRIVICQKEPTTGKRGAFRMRDHQQAEAEFKLLKAAMTELESCRYGLWTNGLEFFFFEKEETRFDVRFRPVGDWPMADESLGTRDVVSQARLRRADAEMLRTTFRRCHNFIHGNEGMPKDAAFWQFLYLIFTKMH
ncbi:MAG: hypothetical protein GY856_15415, partial [bacterium]|nr:hypothetical protein [bacterium]